jgi:serine/threonine-protein kinase HipA
MTSERECYVYIVLPGSTEFVTAARFKLSTTRDGIPIGELVYGKKYLARKEAIELDPIELRLGQTHYETARMNGFFGALRDAMPDFWGRRIIERHAGKIDLDEFDYLMCGSDDRAGALGFGLNVTPPAPLKHYNKTIDLEKLQQMAEAIIKDEKIPDHLPADINQVQELLLAGTSMGGARPKAVVEDDNSLWIAKFSSPYDSWNYPLVEFSLLDLANKCGINIADHKMTRVANKDVLMVRRFDRNKSEKGYNRYRMVSALTLLKSDENPTDRENWSYLILADEIRRVSASPKEDLHELFKRMCFNALVSNLDDHPRNHAILAKDKKWRLSPAYDLTPTQSIAKETRYLAMKCGINGRLAQKDNLLSGYGRFLLSKEDAENIIDKMIEIISAKWYATLRHAGVSEQDCQKVSSAFLNEGFFYPYN